MGRPKKYSDELRRRAVDEVLERGRKIPEVADQLGIATPESLRRWVRQNPRAQISHLRRCPKMASDQRKRLASAFDACHRCLTSRGLVAA
jgi:transposase-like protein